MSIKSTFKVFAKIVIKYIVKIEKLYCDQKKMVSLSGRYIFRSLELGNVLLDTQSVDEDLPAKLGAIERYLYDIFNVLVRTDSIVLDIGANAGMHSLFFAEIQRKKFTQLRACKSRDNNSMGKVIPFEPVPHMFKKLQRNVRLNPAFDIEPVEACVSDNSGQVEMFMVEEGTYEQGNHSLVANEKIDGILRGKTRKILVAAVTIDEYLSSNSSDLPVSFIKIDVEGAESKVLRGAIETIDKYKPAILLEFIRDRLLYLKIDAREFQPLIEMGYVPFTVFGDGSMHKLDSLQLYMEKGLYSNDTAIQKKLGRTGSIELLFLYEKSFV